MNARTELIAMAITDRIAPPTPEQVKIARLRAGLSQAQAAALVSSASSAPRRSWGGYEKTDGVNKRTIPLATWELFLLLTDQHPMMKAVSRDCRLGADHE